MPCGAASSFGVALIVGWVDDLASLAGGIRLLRRAFEDVLPSLDDGQLETIPIRPDAIDNG